MAGTKRVDVLAGLLEDLDITNHDLAVLCEVSNSTVQRWLAGTSPIPMAVLRMCQLMVHLKQASAVVDVRKAFRVDPGAEEKEDDGHSADAVDAHQ